MRYALPLTLIMGGLSLCLALTGGVTAYLLWLGQPPAFVTLPASSLVALPQSTLVGFERVFAAAAWFSAIWGSVCAAAFFYAHVQLRRAADSAVLQSL
jgi:hypothetical protein